MTWKQARQDIMDCDRKRLFERRVRSEEHTSELQSRLHIVCRLLLEKTNARCRAHDSNSRKSQFLRLLTTAVGRSRLRPADPSAQRTPNTPAIKSCQPNLPLESRHLM